MPEVVLVHGLWHRAWSLVLLRRHLEAEGFRVRCFSYPTWNRKPFESTTELADFCRRTSSSQLHLAGHSLGGLLILKMLEQQDQDRQQIPPGQVVLLGSPVSGSQVAKRIATTVPGRLFLRHAESSLINGVDAIPPQRKCGMIAGNLPQGLGRLTGRIDGPNDGTVAVSETVSDQLDDHIQLAVSHTGLLISSQVTRQLAFFVREGCFDHSN